MNLVRVFLSLFGLLAVFGVARADDAYRLKVFWDQELKSHSLDELKRFRQVSHREKDPASGRLAQWKGVLLSDLIEAVLKPMTAERRAQIDLIILRNPGGRQAMVPRAFLVKYPMLLALSRDGGELGASGPVYSVPPWTSHDRTMRKEGFALETFFVPGVTRIELGNSRERFARFYLKRRTDPAAMRGERIFVQACVGCHSAGPGPSIQDLTQGARGRDIASSEHPAMAGLPQLEERDRRAIVSYLNAFRAEHEQGQKTSALAPFLSFASARSR